MHSPNPPTSTALVNRFSIATHTNNRPTPASSSPNLSPSSDRAAPLKQSDRPFPGHSLSPCDRPNQHPPLPQRNNPSLRQGSAKRSACLHPSQKSLSLARPSRKTMRYRFGFLWGLWLRVAVQNIIRNSPQRMPCGKRSCILYSPTQAAGATA
jgi:hypothetical protein